MRVQVARTNDHMWYREGGSNSWGLGFDVEHHADQVDTGTDMELVGAGVTVTLTLGIWTVSFFSEQAFLNVFGSSAAHYGRFSVAP